jgi:PAS domain S-box-containing protein
LLKTIQWQPQRAVVVLAMAVAIILAALVGYDLQREYALALESAGAKTRGLAQLLEEHARQSMRRTELALTQASAELCDQDLSKPAVRAAVRSRLFTHLPKDNLVGSFAVISKAGEISVATAATSGEVLPLVNDRDFFRAYERGGPGGLFVGAAVKSRISGKWIIPVSIPRFDAAGAFDGVLMATLDPGYFQQFYESIDAGTNGFVTLFSREGWAVARAPFVEKVAASNWAETPMFTEHLSKLPVGTVRQVVAADGVERIYSYRTLKDYPLIVAIGVSLTDGLAAWRQRLWVELALIALMLVVLGAATALLVRQLRERLRVESALKLSETSVQKASLPTLWIARDARILRVNQATCAMYGYSEAELLSMSITDLSPHFPPERWPQHWQELRDQKSLSFESTHRTRDGRMIPIGVELNFIEFDGQEFNFAFMRDISERKRAEAEIVRGERMLRDAIDAVDEAFVLFDPQDVLVYCNEKYRNLYPGLEHLMVPGTHFEELVRTGARIGLYKESIGNEEEWIRGRLQAHRDGVTVRVQKRGDGQVLRVIDRKTADGHTVGFRVDITEMVRATEAAQDASRYKSQFLANMSHEIRTPMNAILGLLRLLQSTPLNPQQRDYAHKTDSAARSLLGLLNDILDFSKVEAGKMTLDPQPFRLDRLLRDIAVVLSSNMGSKPVEVLFDIDTTLPPVLVGDAMRLQQVLINLGANAVKFTEHGQVVLRVCKAPDGARWKTPPEMGDAAPDGTRWAGIAFSVKDSGIGIDAENQERVFSGFSQAEASTTRRFGGTGLGLAICRRLVELMGGELTLQSALGQGSTFAFSLHFPVPATPPAELAEMPRSVVTHRSVLVVDDNAVSNAVMAQITRSWGWRTECALDGAQALDLIATHRAQSSNADVFPFDVIYLDWQMPGMDGWEVARQIRSITAQQGCKEPVIVMVTGNGRDTLALRTPAEQRLINAFLFKPVTASMLLDAALGQQTMDVRLRSPGQPSSERRLAGLRILVVEDNLINQQVAEELLNLEGATVSLAANGQLGFEAVASAQPQFDVVLMDIQMPVLDGYGATALIRHQLGLADLPIIAMTANAMASDRVACLAAGMNDHVGKPFDMAHLAFVVLRAVGREAVAPEAAAPVPAAGEVLSRASPPAPYLDIASALVRLSGNKAIYLRVAREFDLALATTVAQYRQCAQQPEIGPLALQLHTLKGTAATLGATALSVFAAGLEKDCRNTADFAPMQHVHNLESIVFSTRRALADAVAQIESESSRNLPALHSGVDPTEPVSAERLAAAHAALEELHALAIANDLTVLARFDALRPLLAVCASAPLAALEQALQSLDLPAAARACRAMQVGA